MDKFERTKTLFSILLEVISKKRKKYVNSLGQSLSPDEVRALISIQPVPDELVAIYTCVRGTPWDHEDTKLWGLIPGYGLIAINEINEIINKFIEWRNEGIEQDWQPDMIPFLQNYSGDYYFIRSLEDDNSIVSLIHDAGLYSSIYQNIEHFILTTIDCYKKKLYVLEEGILADNDKLDFIKLKKQIKESTKPLK